MPTVPLQLWLRLQALLWLPWLVAIGVYRDDAAWLRTPTALLVLVSYAVLVALLRAGRRIADAVTIVRLLGVATVLYHGAQELSTWTWFAALGVVMLDLADGAVARHYGPTPQGAVLDMETDQFTVLALATLVVWHGGLPHVLILPGLRYGFVFAMWAVGAPAHDPKPVAGDNRRGRRVCAAVLVALLAALWPGTPNVVRDVLSAAAVILLAWSFAGDAAFLVRHRRAARSRA